MEHDTSPHPHPQPAMAKPKRSVTQGACVMCKKRKSKCDGNRPACACCIQKNSECVYELGPNEKPSQAMKRKNDEMQNELLDYRQLFDYLKLCPDHEANEMLRRIRTTSSDAPQPQRIKTLLDSVRHSQASGLHPPSLEEQTQYVTLPPIRLALDSPTNLSPYSSPYSAPLPMDVDGPVTQRRRYTNDTDVSAR